MSPIGLLLKAILLSILLFGVRAGGSVAQVDDACAACLLIVVQLCNSSVYMHTGRQAVCP